MSDDQARYGADPSADVLGTFIVARDLHREGRRLEREGKRERAAALHGRGRRTFLAACDDYTLELRDSVLAVRRRAA